MNVQRAPAEVTESHEQNSSARLQGRWLNLARCVWVFLIVSALGLFVASIPTYYASLHILNASSPPSVGGQLTPHDAQILKALALTVDFYAWYNVLSAIVFECVFLLVGLIIFLRKSDDRMALLASFTLIMFPFSFSSNSLSTLPQSWLLAIKTISFLSSISFYLFFYLFPDGRFVPSWTRWLALGMVAFEVVNTFFPSLPFNQSVFPFVIFLGLTASVVVVQVYRYRGVSTPLQRQQTKWVVFGVSVAAIGFLTAVVVLFLVLPPFFHSDRPDILSILIISTIASLLIYLIPISIAIAILRSRLFDIDVLINRTLVYGALTVILTGVYVGLVIGLQALLRGIISQDSGVAIVISTLAIAALFQPLRRRIQRVIDRRFYRSKYDAAKTVAAFSATLRNEVDLEQLREQLLAVVQETMQPAHVSLWLRPPEHNGKQRAPWRANPPGSSQQK
jgi:hypothetical protein